MPVLKRYSFDFYIKHPWIKECNLKLNSFKHKGYWYHRKNREKASMMFFELLINPDFIIVEVGGHIGFITLYFANLVGEKGKVFVFEPGSNNLPYIRGNINRSRYKNIIELLELAIGETDNYVSFYEDSLTGQNNSLVKNFEGLRRNTERSYIIPDVSEKIVKMTSLDKYFYNLNIDFIKIDIEGYEWPALQGASSLVRRCHPAFMVEVQANENEIFEYFLKNDYLLFNENRSSLKEPNELKQNVFCLHRQKHGCLIKQLIV